MFKVNFKNVVVLLTIIGAFALIAMVAFGAIPDKNRELFSMLSVLVLRETLSKSMRNLFPEKEEKSGSES